MALEDLFNRLKKNHETRQKQLVSKGVNCYRWYDRDMPEWPLVIDVYADTAVVWSRDNDDRELLSDADGEALQQFLAENLFIRPNAVYWKKRTVTDRSVQYQKQETASVIREVLEGKRRYLVNVSDYLDCGLFLDHRPLRYALDTLPVSAGETWLNLFAYTCSLSVPAAMRGVNTVQVDLSTTYLEWGEKNFAINRLNPQQFAFIKADILQWLDSSEGRKLLDQATVVICDPPIFSRSKKMQQSFDILRDQEFLLGTILKHLRPDALVVFSTPRQKFKLSPNLTGTYQTEDWTKWSIPCDFHQQRTHHLFALGKEKTPRWRELSQRLRPII